MAKLYIDGSLAFSRSMPNLENATYHDFLYMGAASLSVANSIEQSQFRFTGKMACVGIFDGEIDQVMVNQMILDPRCPLETGKLL